MNGYLWGGSGSSLQTNTPDSLGTIFKTSFLAASLHFVGESSFINMIRTSSRTISERNINPGLSVSNNDFRKNISAKVITGK